MKDRRSGVIISKWVVVRLLIDHLSALFLLRNTHNCGLVKSDEVKARKFQITRRT